MQGGGGVEGGAGDEVGSVELNFTTTEAENAKSFQDFICFRVLRQ